MDRINPSIPEVLLIALVGFLTVFTVLVVLMGIITLISVLFSDNKKSASNPTAAPVPEAVSTPAVQDAADTYEGVKLIGVSDKEAAMLMAIVADELDKPLDNLRFISIKEVK